MANTVYHSAERMDVPEGTVCFLRKGAGAPTILLHGAPLSLFTWRYNLEPLASGLDVIALDLKGFGRSSKQNETYSLETQIRFLLQVMDKLRLPRTNFVGNSYGCAIALSLASMYPERVDRLVLINSVGYPGGKHSLERLLRIGVLRKVLEPTLRSSLFGRRVFASGLRRSYADPNLVTPEVIDAYFQLLRSESGERTFLSTLEELDEGRLAAIIPSIPHETLIIWGAKDHILPVGNAWRFLKEMRCAHLEVLSECGHLPHEEDPDRINSLILRFLGARDGVVRESKTAQVSMVERA